MNDQSTIPFGLSFVLSVCALLIAGIIGIPYWRDCFIWGHLCTHDIIEVFQKLYCGVAGPTVVVLVIVHRDFKRLPCSVQRYIAAINVTLLAAFGILYAFGYGH